MVNFNKYLNSIIPGWTFEKDPLNIPSDIYSTTALLESISEKIRLSIKTISMSPNGFKVELQDVIDKVLNVDMALRAHDILERSACDKGISSEAIHRLKEKKFELYKNGLQELNLVVNNESEDREELMSYMVKLVRCYLIESGVNINALNQQDTTILFEACKNGDLERVKLLIALGADVNIPSEINPIPNWYQNVEKPVSAARFSTKASENNKNTIFSFMLSLNNTPKPCNLVSESVAPASSTGPSQKFLNLSSSVSYEDSDDECEDIVHRMRVASITPHARAEDSTNDGMTPLHVACEKGNSNLVTLLIDAGANLNFVFNNMTPLYRAIYYNNKKCAKIIIEAGCDLTIPGLGGKQLIHLACEKGFTDIVHLMLMKNGALMHAKSPTGQTPFHIACLKGFEGVVNILINNRYFDINAKDENGNTPLLLAFYSSRYSIVVKALLEKNADPNISNNEKETPWSTLLRRWYVDKPLIYEIAELLIERGAIVTSVKGKELFFMQLLVKCKTSVMKHVTRMGLDFFAHDENGTNLMMHLIRFNDPKLLPILKTLPLDYSKAIQNEDGITIIHSAADVGNWELVDYFIEQIVDSFIEQGIAINANLIKGKELFFMQLLVKCKTSVMKHVIRMGLDFFEHDENGTNLMMHLIRFNDPRLLPILKTLPLDYSKAIPNKDGMTIIHSAEDAENWELRDYFIEQGVVTNANLLNGIESIALEFDQYEKICALRGETYEVIAENGGLIRTSCGHMFERTALIGWIDMNTRRGDIPNCPDPGCHNVLSNKDTVVEVSLNPHHALLQNTLDHLVTLNCHGTFGNNEEFHLPPNFYIMAPHPQGFEKPYVIMSPAQCRSFEELIAERASYDFLIPSSGGWKLYIPGDSVSNLRLSPWRSDRFKEWSDRNPDDASMINTQNGTPPFSKTRGKNSKGQVVHYGTKEAQKVVIFRGKNMLGEKLTLKDIVRHLFNTNQNPGKPIVLIPFCCNASGANDDSITCTEYGGTKLENVLSLII